MADTDYKAYTEHYKLVKPGDLEKYNIEDVTRTNADIIDAELYKHEIAIKNLHNYDDSAMKKDIAAINTELGKHTETNTQINQKIDALTELVQSMKITTYRIDITSDIVENEEYELPCQYIVRQW